MIGKLIVEVLNFESGYYKKDKTQKPAQTTNIWVPKKKIFYLLLICLIVMVVFIILQLSMYAYMVESILGIPNAGLWLCHIDSDFVLNKYGMPKRFPDGLYHIKDNPVEQVTVHKMKYRREEIKAILYDRSLQVKAYKQQSKTLF